MQAAPSINITDWRRTLAPGDDVFWRDPDRNFSSGIYQIVTIVGGKMIDEDSVLVLRNAEGSNVEVVASELAPNKPDNLWPVYDRADGQFVYVGMATSEQEAKDVAARSMEDEVAEIYQAAEAPLPSGVAVDRCWVAVGKKDSLHNPIRLRLELDVAYVANGVEPALLVANLERLVAHAIGEGLLTGDSPAEVHNHSVRAIRLAPAGLETAFRGTLQFEGVEMIELDFAAGADASKEQRDSAYLDALSQIAQVNYIAIGDAPNLPVEEDWHVRMCELAGIRLVEAQEEEVRGRWDWIGSDSSASNHSFGTKAEAAEAAVKARFPLNDWQYLAKNRDTRASYRQWVESEAESAAHDVTT